MRSHSLTRSLAVLATAGGLLLAACGGDDSSSSTQAPAATQTPATTAMGGSDTTMMGGSDTTAMGGSDAMMGAYGSGCAAVPTDGAGSFAGMAQDPAATAASNNPLLSTLVTAVTKANLGDTLNGPGPFTIFAPVNDAFAAVPAADLNALLADPDALTKVLTYHVIAGEQLNVADLVKMGKATTVEGQDLTFTAGPDDGLMVNGVEAICMSLPTANATVHIISGVLMPPS